MRGCKVQYITLSGECVHQCYHVCCVLRFLFSVFFFFVFCFRSKKAKNCQSLHVLHWRFLPHGNKNPRFDSIYTVFFCFFGVCFIIFVIDENTTKLYFSPPPPSLSKGLKSVKQSFANFVFWFCVAKSVSGVMLFQRRCVSVEKQPGNERINSF